MLTPGVPRGADRDGGAGRALPVLIQGGMGVAVSNWRLAGAVSRAGGLGVVSGVALDTVLARRLQDGDRSGQLREALASFPVPGVAERIVDRYHRPGGRPPGRPYRPVPRLGLRQTAAGQELAVAAAFVEVHLAKTAAGGRPIGINLLEKIQLATPTAVYGALLAGVDVVLVGAGIPSRLPALLDALAAHRPVRFPVDVAGDPAGEHAVTFDPAALFGDALPPLRRPTFLAIVSSHVLATWLARAEVTRPDGFIVEGPVAGGHNAPPRGQLRLDPTGQPEYGPRDEVDLARLAGLGLPFWLAGGYGRPERLAAALAAGAAGVQVGTPFALARESGLADPVRRRLVARAASGELAIRTDPRASPTGFPFKLAWLRDTLADPAVYRERPRLCDLGYLRTPYARPDGSVGYRCPAEPVDSYLRKGGRLVDTPGRVCLCNGLTSTVGIGQVRKDGYAEPSAVTLGADLAAVRELLRRHPGGWSAADVVRYLCCPDSPGELDTAADRR